MENSTMEERKERAKTIVALIISHSAVALAVLLACTPLKTKCAECPVLDTPAPSPIPTLTRSPTLTFAPTPTRTPTATPIPTPYADIEGGINVRSGPSLDYDVIATLEAGDAVPITGYHGKWWRIEYAGDVGWVAAWVTSSHNVSGVPLVQP